MRKKLIAANWKMHKTPAQAAEFMRAFLPMVAGHQRDDVVVCPPFVCLPATVEAAKGSRVAVGAQDLFWEDQGAYTGEVSAAMLVAAGCTHVIIGHSDRRQYFGETDDAVNRKLKAALAAGLQSIVCVGELLEEREAGLTEKVLRRQCSIAFRGIAAESAARLNTGVPAAPGFGALGWNTGVPDAPGFGALGWNVAYEPVWAIGTGRTAPPKLAAQAHGIIRQEAARFWGKDFAAQLRILYGGSVKPENAAALMAEAEIDGALVGGASLDPKSFAAIVKYSL